MHYENEHIEVLNIIADQWVYMNIGLWRNIIN